MRRVCTGRTHGTRVAHVWRTPNSRSCPRRAHAAPTPPTGTAAGLLLPIMGASQIVSTVVIGEVGDRMSHKPIFITVNAFIDE